MAIEIKTMETDAEIRGKAYVHWKSWQEAYPGLLDQAYLDRLTLEKCENIAFSWPENTLVAKDGERVVGFACYGPYRDGELPDAGEVYAIYVLADYWDKGVGRRLMDEALERLRAYPRAAVWVLKGNERAIAFYRRCGYRPDGREQQVMIGGPVMEIRMVLARQA